MDVHYGHFAFLCAFCVSCMKRPSNVHCLLSENKPPSLYFGTDGGVKRYSLEDNQVKRVANSSERAFGVVFDWLRDKIYWTGEYQAFQANRDGTEVEAALDTRKCKSKFCSFVNPIE